MPRLHVCDVQLKNNLNVDFITEEYLKYKDTIERLIKESSPTKLKKIISSLGKTGEFKNYAKSFPGMKEESLYEMFLEDYFNMIILDFETNFKSYKNEKTSLIIKRRKKVAAKNSFEKVNQSHEAMQPVRSRSFFRQQQA